MMPRSVLYRVKAGPGAWQRATGTVPFNITGLTNDVVYELDDGNGTLVERTPVGASRSITRQTTLVYASTAINVHTFPAGFTASTDDTIVLGISARNSSGTFGLLSVTIGGQTMTIDGQAAVSIVAAHAIRKLTAPIEATDDIVVTWNTTGLYGDVNVVPWRCVGYAGAFHNANTGANSVNSTSVSTTVNVPADGAVFVTQTNGNPTLTEDAHSITGATKEVDRLLGTIRRTVAGSVVGLASETGRGITVTGDQDNLRRVSAVTVGVA